MKRQQEEIEKRAAEAQKKKEKDKKGSKQQTQQKKTKKGTTTSNEQEETENKVKAIHLAEEQYPDVSFAIGSYTEDDCRKVRHALMQADARMYEDKKRFYQSQAASRTHRPDPFAGV
jgi:hypothetical protein